MHRANCGNSGCNWNVDFTVASWDDAEFGEFGDFHRYGRCFGEAFEALADDVEGECYSLYSAIREAVASNDNIFYGSPCNGECVIDVETEEIEGFETELECECEWVVMATRI